MEAVGNEFRRPVRQRNDKGRRSWSVREEEILVAGMKEIIAGGWKSDNGFRMGYLQPLAQYIARALPGTDLKANPHINSRIHTWKKNYSSLFSMLRSSGIGLHHKTKMIEASDEAWNSYVNTDPNARLMRGKEWPLYEDWCEIFGKDRATGVGAEDYVEAAAKEKNMTEKPEDLGHDTYYAGLVDETDTVSESQAESSATVKRGTTKKRKGSNDDPAIEIVHFCKDAAARLGEIASRIGHEVDMSNARKTVFEFVEKLDGFTLQEKLIATQLLVKNSEDLDIFLGLPEVAKEEWTRMKLAGKLL